MQVERRHTLETHRLLGKMFSDTLPFCDLHGADPTMSLEVPELKALGSWDAHCHINWRRGALPGPLHCMIVWKRDKHWTQWEGGIGSYPDPNGKREVTISWVTFTSPETTDPGPVLTHQLTRQSHKRKSSVAVLPAAPWWCLYAVEKPPSEGK